MSPSIRNDLENFIRKETGIISNKTLRRATSLEDDLDVTGDDADILMEKFFDYFSVDVGDFDIDRYFFGEGGGLLFLLVSAIFKKNAERNLKIPLTLGMLEKSIDLKRWDSNIIENSKE